ncbi:MAG: enoyl-CoA hydratase-related protein [Acidimicrobiaceae bacterium]|nr:enoyl-CoA hydratase-related protein [Acidimicrobiaceae bacterium]
MAHPNIHVEPKEDVTTVTIDRPRRKNACTPAMFAALREAFRDIALSPARAVVLTGSGGDFCAGADVGPAEEDSAEPQQPQRHRVEHMRDIADTVMAIHDCPRPVIAKVDGVAVGAGFGIALAADLAWCSSRARFSLIFAKRGLSLDFGTSWLLPKRVGLHEAKRLALTGEIIDAARAVELGIVNGVVEVGELDAQVAETAARIAAGPPIALASSKRLLNNAAGVSLFQALEAEGLSQAVNFSTSDTAEAMSAFVDKRDPVFKGR